MTMLSPDRTAGKPGFGERLLRPALLVSALVITALLSATGAVSVLDRGLRQIQDSVLSRPASGKVHIVELDAKSIAAFKQWPWPRSLHARAVDNLSRADVGTIAFDVDFSSATTATEDAALARALANAKTTVVLPTFRQRAGGTSQGMVESLPVPEFRRHAFLGSVNVHPDRDGIMRRYSTGTVTQGVARPSLAAVIGNFAGQIEQSFLIDTAIEPDTIPRHSFADLVEGRIPDQVLKGKQILIGATAIELGDRYVLPRHGVQPGVVAQALAAETLLSGRLPVEAGWLPAILAVLAPAWMLAGPRRRFPVRAIIAGAVILVLGVSLTLQATRLAYIDTAASLVFLGTIAAMVSLIRFMRQLHDARFGDARSGLANERQLVTDLAQRGDGYVAVMRIGQSDGILAMLDDEMRRQLFHEIVQRLAPVTGGSKAYSLDANQIAWVLEADSHRTLQAHLEGAVSLFVAPLMLGSRLQIVSPVFGFADHPATDAAQPQTTVRNAALAAARAEEGGVRAVRFVEALRETAGFEQRILADIGPALARGELHMAYQPKWSIRQDRVAGFEALIRWTHPELGRIMPDQFITVLENAGRIDELTLYAIDACVHQLRTWHSEGRDLGVAVNISAGLLSDPQFATASYERVAALGPLASHLTFEITETVAFAGDGAAADLLRKLRDLGLRVSVDDYGTGQSTLSYLKAFPANEIKIDKGFVLRMVQSPSDQILVRSTIELAHELGFTVVAEGVEDTATLALLRRFGCDIAQGWCVGKPLPVGEFDIAAINERMRNDLKMVA